jgi:hypothetical protein
MLYNISEGETCQKVYTNYEKYLYDSGSFDYNIYDYMVSLQEKHGVDVADFRFDNFVFLNEWTRVFDEMSQNPGKSNYTHKDLFLNKPIVSERDKRYFASLKKMKNITDCVDRKLLGSKLTGSNRKFANVVAKSMNRYSFKSVHNTENVVYMGHHMALKIKPDTRSLKVPPSDGVMSHFRDHMYSSDIKKNKWEKIFSSSIIDWIVDVELFFLIVKLFK